MDQSKERERNGIETERQGVWAGRRDHFSSELEFYLEAISTRIFFQSERVNTHPMGENNVEQSTALFLF